MLRFLFGKDCDQEKIENNIQMRTKCSIWAGVIGIFCNLLLFGIKLAVGITSKSIAIISDAFNNLSDMGTSVVSITGAKLSAKRPDREHPFGHGRVEYVSSLIVAFIIVVVGFELLKASGEKILNPSSSTLNTLMLFALCVSIVIKLFMFAYNRYLGKLINSGVLKATATDSINDVFATSAVILSTVLGVYFKILWLDGVVGLIVSAMIMYSGIKIALDTIDILLGAAPSPEITEGIKSRILASEDIVGVHDLVVHDYGPGRTFASVHAEVSDSCGIVEIHEVIDALEKNIEAELGVHIVIHIDPIISENEYVAGLRDIVSEVILSIDKRLRIHDFKVSEESDILKLIFDIEVPSDTDNVEELEKLIIGKIKSKNEKFEPVIKIDYV